MKKTDCAERLQPLTEEVMAELIKSSRFEAFYSDNVETLGAPTLTQYLAELCESRGITSAQLLRDVDIERSFGHRIFIGERSLSRDNALKLALGLKATLKETSRILVLSKNNQLYPKIPRDAAIIYCIYYKKSYRETQDNLYDWGMTVLGEEVKYEKIGKS